MPFRPVFIAIVIAFALILGAFLIQRARPRVELDQPNANFVRATGVLHAEWHSTHLLSQTCFSVKAVCACCLTTRSLRAHSLRACCGFLRPKIFASSCRWLPLNVTCNRYANCSYRSLTKWGSRPFSPLGAMIETPAAALTVGRIARHADFLSVVTNDLTQYTLIAGRDNATVRDYYEDTHPSMLRLLGIIIAEEAGLDLRRARGSRGSHPNANGNRLPCAQYFPSADLDNERANQIDWHQKTCEPTLIEVCLFGSTKL